MNAQLPGVGGSLFPSRFLSSGFVTDAAVARSDSAQVERMRRKFVSWWSRVEAACGPATGVRALFDLAAMPLFAQLGFAARHAVFDTRIAHARLESPERTPVGLVVLPWASRPSAIWRDVATTARRLGADWCFVLAPPFLSLVDARGHAFRRSVDFSWPDALDPRSATVLWTLAHASRFDGQPRGAAIDDLVRAAGQFQDRVREDLQHGVVDALAALTQALARPRRRHDVAGPFDEALTLVYRVLFLLFAESRELVPHRHPVYGGVYALGTLCRDAVSDASPAGLWDALAAITRLSRAGCRADDLIVTPFNGRLFARSAAPSLEDARLSPRGNVVSHARDRAMHRTLVSLGTRLGPAGREAISYADLGVEQLGAVYERVLDLDPGQAHDARPPRPLKRGPHSAHRKESGTFYTPRSLAEFVVRRTLAPLVSGATSDRILELRVLDPAMGSGAFLVAACRYLSQAYARALVDEGRCAETDLDAGTRADIRRRIAERCLAGVDANPVAVQLARLSLWLATLAHGKPLGFLDHRLRTGNSLIGGSPDMLRAMATGRRTRDQPLPLFEELDVAATLTRIVRPLSDLMARRDNTIDDIRAKETIWTRVSARGTQDALGRLRLAVSLWCARWFWDEGLPPSPAEMRAAIDALLKDDGTLRAGDLARWMARAQTLEDKHGFFHWPLEFADVFYDPSGQPRRRPGFDAVIGNPPWEMLRHDHEHLRTTDATRHHERPGQAQFVRFVRESGLYPSCDRGHVNLYQPFLDRSLSLARDGGRVGLVVPWGLASDDGAAGLRRRLLDRSATDTIVGLDNAGGLFPIHRGLRFLVVVTSPGDASREIRARFGVRTAQELDDLPDSADASLEAASAYPVRLSPGLLARATGPARRFPDARRASDLALLVALADQHPRLGDAAGWQARFGRELNATEDRAHFGARGLPVIEGKHVAAFTADADAPACRIESRQAALLLPGRPFDRPRLAYRDVSGVTNRSSLIAAIVPRGVVTTHTLFCLRTAMLLEHQHFLCGVFNSYVLNVLARMLMGGHLTTGLVESLPVPVWRHEPGHRRIARLAGRLSTRPHPRTEAALQGAVAHLYGLDEAAFERVLEHFPLVPAETRRLALDAFRGAFTL